MSKGPLIRVEIGKNRWVKMYEQDAIAKGLLQKEKPQAANKMRQPAENKLPEKSAEVPAGDDFSAISGVGKSTVETLHEHGIFTFDQLMESDLGFLPGKVRQAIEKYFGG